MGRARGRGPVLRGGRESLQSDRGPRTCGRSRLTAATVAASSPLHLLSVCVCVRALVRARAVACA